MTMTMYASIRTKHDSSCDPQCDETPAGAHMTMTMYASISTKQDASCTPQSSCPHQEEWLVRFQDRTYVLYTNKRSNMICLDERNERIVQQVSLRTGWPCRFLQVSSLKAPFAHVRLVSSIRGGKGGFGTLLKGQSRQAGARTTLNFGACRDLQGRRLRHVNDQIAWQQWQEWTEKVERGVATTQEMAQALVKTNSGVAGWHLQLPTWASVSKQEQQKLQRQFRRWKMEQDEAAAAKQRQKELHERQVESYVDSAVQASENVQTKLKSALEQGLAAQKRQKTADVEKDPPEALLTLSGDVVLAYENGVWQMQSQSNFCTVGIILQQDQATIGEKKSGDSNRLLYWEVGLQSGGLAQIGWWAAATAAGGGSSFRPNSETGDGAGDCQHSWAYDGSRRIKLHNETTESYGLSWKQGDTVGCLLDQELGQISFALNGQDMGVAFTVHEQGEDGASHMMLFPAISCNPGEIVELRLKESEMKSFPAGALAIGDIMSTEDVVIPPKDPEIEDLVDESAKPVNTDKSETKVDVSQQANTQEKAAADVPKKPTPVVVEALDLDKFDSVEELEELGLDRLKGALIAIGIKCGGTLKERATRLFSLKGLSRHDYPKKLLAKRK